MDISKFEIKSGSSDLIIRHPKTGEETDIVIQCISLDHPEYRQKALESIRGAAGKKIVANKLILEKQNEMVAQCVVGWKNVVNAGKEIKYSHKAAVDLFQKCPWIREQVDEFCSERENFFTGSAKN